MKVAELFVELGLKGAVKAKRGLSDIRDKMGDLKSTSIQAKAAIVAAIYALERMSSASGEWGMSLKNLSVLTGVSEKKIQQWREAFRLSGEAAEDADINIRAVQKSMARMMLAEGGPKWLGVMGVDPERAEDTLYVLQKYREFIQKGGDKQLVNQIAEDLGLTDSFIVMARKFKGDIGKIDKNVLSGGQIENLAKLKMEWSDFWKSLEMMRNEFFAAFGSDMVGSLNNVLKIVRDIVNWVKEIPELVDGIKMLGVTLFAVFNPISATIAAIVAGLDQIQKWREGKENIITDTGYAAKGLWESIKEFAGGGTRASRAMQSVNGGNVTVNQYFNGPPEKNVRKAADDLKKIYKSTAFQNTSGNQRK